MAAMRAMHARLCGLGYVKPTARAAGPTTSKQQSMRLAMAMGSGPGLLHGRAPDLVQLDRRLRPMRGYPLLLASLNERLPPTARRRRAKQNLAVVEGEATPLPPLWREGRPYPPTLATPPLGRVRAIGYA